MALKHTVTSIFCCRIVQFKGKLTKQRCDLQMWTSSLTIAVTSTVILGQILMVWNYVYNYIKN